MGNRCLYKSETNEVSMLTGFMQASLAATTITHGGDITGVTDRLTNCPDSKEKYDLARGLVLSPSATTKSREKPTEVTWHKLFRGGSQEWFLISSAGDKFITSFKSKSKGDVLSYLKKHGGAHVIYAAPNTEEPVTN